VCVFACCFVAFWFYCVFIGACLVECAVCICTDLCLFAIMSVWWFGVTGCWCCGLVQCRLFVCIMSLGLIGFCDLLRLHL